MSKLKIGDQVVVVEPLDMAKGYRIIIDPWMCRHAKEKTVLKVTKPNNYHTSCWYCISTFAEHKDSQMDSPRYYAEEWLMKVEDYDRMIEEQMRKQLPVGTRCYIVKNISQFDNGQLRKDMVLSEATESMKRFSRDHVEMEVEGYSFKGSRRVPGVSLKPVKKELRNFNSKCLYHPTWIHGFKEIEASKRMFNVGDSVVIKSKDGLGTAASQYCDAEEVMKVAGYEGNQVRLSPMYGSAGEVLCSEQVLIPFSTYADDLKKRRKSFPKRSIVNLNKSILSLPRDNYWVRDIGITNRMEDYARNNTDLEIVESSGRCLRLRAVGSDIELTYHPSWVDRNSIRRPGQFKRGTKIVLEKAEEPSLKKFAEKKIPLKVKRYNQLDTRMIWVETLDETRSWCVSEKDVVTTKDYYEDFRKQRETLHPIGSTVKVDPARMSSEYVGVTTAMSKVAIEGVEMEVVGFNSIADEPLLILRPQKLEDRRVYGDANYHYRMSWVYRHTPDKDETPYSEESKEEDKASDEDEAAGVMLAAGALLGAVLISRKKKQKQQKKQEEEAASEQGK